MHIKLVDRAPTEVREFNADPQLSPEQVQHVAEIFNTPLTGAYNWDYSEQDNRIRKLYDLGKQLNWNADIDIDWSQTADLNDRPALTPTEKEQALVQFREGFPFADYQPYLDMDIDTQLALHRHLNSWFVSQFLHGEQGALLVASQLVSCAPSFNAKLYAASQTFDEARHVEVFNRSCFWFSWPCRFPVWHRVL